MNFVSAFVVFIMIWWTVIFCVLPIGLSTTQEEAEEGEYLAPGAPKEFNLKKKLLITTIISIVLWGIVYMVISSDIIDFRNMINDME